jgi:neutral trehalase
MRDQFRQRLEKQVIKVSQDERMALVRQHQELQEQIQGMAPSSTRRDLTLELSRIAKQLSLMPKPKQPYLPVSGLFMEAAKEILPAHVFRQIMTMAQERLDESVS